MTEPTPDEMRLYNEINVLGLRLSASTKGLRGSTTDPRMFSAALFSRLRSNHRGYTILWKKRQSLEADIILRSAVETAICIAANHKLRHGFVAMMKQDAAFTIQGQIKTLREGNDADMVRYGEKVLRDMKAAMPQGAKAAKLDWKALAEHGEVPILYRFHRMLSGVSSHVTGLSILRSMTNETLAPKHQELDGIERRMHLMMMATAMLHGAMFHASLLDVDEEVAQAATLMIKLDESSIDWPS